MAEVSPSLSVITLSVNGLNSPIKRQRLAEWTKTTIPLYAAYNYSLYTQIHKQVENKRMEKDIPCKQ